MPISVDAIAPGRALGALASAVGQAKAGDPLAPVTVIVPTNTAGVMARRALGRRGGVAAVDMLTLYRLAELIGSPALVAEGRSPVSTAVVDLAIRRVLSEAPGSFATVAEHPSTVVALRDLHRELRLAGPDAVAALTASSPHGREATRISQLTTRRLRAGWYDEGDLLDQAELATRHAVPRQLANTIVYLPQQLHGRELRLIRGLGRVADVQVILGVTGDAGADLELADIATALGVNVSRPSPERPATRSRTLVDVVSTTDADDEVRLAVRAVLDAARAGTSFGRMAVLWSTDRPYARLVEHHLDVAEIEWNGRPGTRLIERLVPRLVLDLLDVDRRGLRRRDLFDLLADVPARGHHGERLNTAAWERVSRAAGVARDDHWTPRLNAYAATSGTAPMRERSSGQRRMQPKPSVSPSSSPICERHSVGRRPPAHGTSGRRGAASRSSAGSAAPLFRPSTRPNGVRGSRSNASSTASGTSTRSVRRCAAASSEPRSWPSSKSLRHDRDASGTGSPRALWPAHRGSTSTSS